MFPALLHHHGRKSQQRHRIIDVDEVSEERARRRSLKKRIPKILKPFKLHHHDDAKSEDHSHSETSKTWDSSDHLHHPIVKLLPKDHDPFEAAEAALEGMSSSSSSVSSLGSQEEDHPSMPEEGVVAESEEIDVDLFQLQAQRARALAKDHSQVVTMMVAASIGHSILNALNETKPSAEVKEIPVLPVPPVVKKLPQELLTEIVLFRWPLRPREEAKHLPQALLKELANFSRPPSPEPARTQPRELRQEIATFRMASAPTSPLKTQPTELLAEIVGFRQETTPTEPATNEEQQMVALKDRCANLSTLTELLTKQLVESTLAKKQNTAIKRKETKYYQDVIRKLKEKHRAECANLVSDKKYLEGKLRRTQIESVPRPIARSTSPPQGKLRCRRRRSFMDTLVTPVEACLKSPKQRASSFSMASNMIMQNKFLPVLAAVAHLEAVTKE